LIQPAPRRGPRYEFLNYRGFTAINTSLIYPSYQWRMNIAALAKEYNEKAVRRNWHERCDPTLSFTETAHRQLLSVWRAKAGQRKMPMRSEITPRDLKDYLKNIILGQREETNPSRYRCRLIGTGLTSILGEHTGQRFEDSIPPELLPRWIEVCDMILESETPWRFLGRVHINGHEYLNAEHLYMPLADQDGTASFVMGYCRYTPRQSVVEIDMQAELENEIASIPGGLL
jgi:hypothetical protein